MQNWEIEFDKEFPLEYVFSDPGQSQIDEIKTFIRQAIADAVKEERQRILEVSPAPELDCSCDNGVRYGGDCFHGGFNDALLKFGELLNKQ